MHFHHRHDVEGCLDAHDTWPEPIRVIIATLDRLESSVSTQQNSIDAAVAVLADVVAEVASLKEQLAAAGANTVDTSKLDEAVAAAQAALAPAASPVVDPAPVAPAADVPADAPAAPVVDAPVIAPAAPAADAVIA